ncbi:YfhO family protein [Aquimarina muelleri]|uniref:Membrane protein n=1 Tax=Aquimarina muelleri TaxID=279356 RepID=A0A918N4P3_9FLAO|nr:YfhO family protein [Aquimarina muelleri]MCX2763780.1 YfhO family protein [Aquimarina muelleri]GGX31013.1 membrane protein [Aquimarina muelleri]
MSLIKRFLPHILVVFSFIIVSLAYFNPVLSGKKMRQGDIVQYTGMARQQTDFRNQTGEEPYWADNAFGGMPTYQMGAQYPHSYIKKIDRIIRFLPRPADYLFLYFIGFYILLLVLKVDYRLAFLGSLAFGFSTYFIIIIGVGHNAKAHAIGYMPLVLSGILLVFRKKYIWGFLLLTLSMALEIAANHFQMTYYLFLLVLVLGVSYLIDAYKKKEIPDYFKSIGIMVVAVLFSLLLNATSLLATNEYAKYSTRGNTGITIQSNGKEKKSTGLDFDYITQYSYGKLESFNLFIPRFMGGASYENLGTNSNTYDELLKLGVSPTQAKSYTEHVPTYWGDQPIVGAPAYIGATVLFLFVFALFLVKGRLKWWIVGGSVLALVLSWGKNFSFLTEFFINYFPMYDKFRAVSSIQVIIELCVPILAIVGIHKLFSNAVSKEEKNNALKYTTAITGGIALLFLLFKSSLFNFSGLGDSMLIEQGGPDYLRAIKEDRKAIFTADTLRSLLFVLLIAAGCWMYLKGKLKENILIIGLGVLIVLDLVLVDWKYVNKDNFVSAREFNKPFVANQADKEIFKDKGHFRVFDLTANPFNSGRASYFHNALGGYHAAKPGRMQDLFEFYLAKNDVGVMNMLNVKYIITEDEDGVKALTNPYANGNAWFVSDIKMVDSANDEILTLKEVDTKKEAIINSSFKEAVPNTKYTVDSLAYITLTDHKPNHLVYESNNEDKGFAIFSEIYYPGWNAYIDGNLVTQIQANYTLRGVPIPAGKHQIEFKFEPQVVKTGSTITLASSILFILLLIGGLYFQYKKTGNILPFTKEEK